MLDFKTNFPLTSWFFAFSIFNSYFHFILNPSLPCPQTWSWLHLYNCTMKFKCKSQTTESGEPQGDEKAVAKEITQITFHTCVTLHHSSGVVQDDHSSLARRFGGVASINSSSTAFITWRGQSRRDTSRLSPTVFKAGPILL